MHGIHGIKIKKNFVISFIRCFQGGMFGCCVYQICEAEIYETFSPQSDRRGPRQPLVLVGDNTEADFIKIWY